MESNWRYGIWDYGFSFANVVLIARLIVPIGVRTGIALFTNGQRRLVTLALVPGQVPTVGGTAPQPDPTANFPWGNFVVPD